MRVQLRDGRVIHIAFKHFNGLKEELGSDRVVKAQYTQSTVTVIEYGTPTEFLRKGIEEHSNKTYLGLVVLSPSDTENRKVGRKHALRAALRNSGLSQHARTEVWKSLMERGVRFS